ncbi:lipopolysaccharide biosynthesis protein [Kribbella flavida DSM 17836]|uniref:Lipopolysaccharide biosynthesis protein n=1 Tax=Kribbella flavida (strain DSM 17836 / JCM 10339 / NBRC 14399) TaxID=479435 RepID=D2PZ01_KRIFD|nr:LPS biosynthesis protein [Kribbella flavida]ADB31795.1 lipopolysaccharide biosynthesis protein [Kribbella flavida DSM 17836]
MKPGRPARDDAIELSAYLRAMRRGTVAVAVCALVGAIAGVLWTVRTPRVYSSTSAVLVADAPLYLAREGEEGAKWFTIDTEAARLVSAPVLEAARQATGERNIRTKLHIAAVPTTKVLKITYRSTDRRAAEKGATAMTATYLQLRRDEFEARRDDRVELIGQQIATLNARLDETLITGRSTAAKVAEQRATRQAIAAQIAARQTESRQVRVTSAYPGQVLRVGGTTAAERINPLVPPVTGLLIGGLAGLLLAAIRSSRLGTASDLTRLVPGGTVVKLRLHDPDGNRTRSWDPITTGVLGMGAGTVLITPPDRPPGELERAAADELSAALRHHGRRAWVIDQSVLPADTVPAANRRSRTSTVLVTGGGITSEPGSVLAALAGHVVLVVTPRTRQRALAEAVHRAGQVGATVQGVVLLTRPGRLVPAVLRRSI